MSVTKLSFPLNMFLLTFYVIVAVTVAVTLPLCVLFCALIFFHLSSIPFLQRLLPVPRSRSQSQWALLYQNNYQNAQCFHGLNNTH